MFEGATGESPHVSHVRLKFNWSTMKVQRGQILSNSLIGREKQIKNPPAIRFMSGLVHIWIIPTFPSVRTPSLKYDDTTLVLSSVACVQQAEMEGWMVGTEGSERGEIYHRCILMTFMCWCCFCSAMLQHEQSAVSIVFMLCKYANGNFF